VTDFDGGGRRSGSPKTTLMAASFAVGWEELDLCTLLRALKRPRRCKRGSDYTRGVDGSYGEPEDDTRSLVLGGSPSLAAV